MDRDKIRAHAQEISVKMMEVFYNNVEKLPDVQGAEEQIYLSSWVSGILSSTFCIAMDGYAKIYDLGAFNCDTFKSWVDEIEKSLIDENKNKVEGLLPN